LRCGGPCTTANKGCYFPTRLILLQRLVRLDCDQHFGIAPDIEQSAKAQNLKGCGGSGVRAGTRPTKSRERSVPSKRGCDLGKCSLSRAVRLVVVRHQRCSRRSRPSTNLWWSGRRLSTKKKASVLAAASQRATSCAMSGGSRGREAG